MAVTYPLTPPSSIGLAQITLYAVNSVAISSSPFTFKQQVQAYSGQMWSADVSLPTQRRDLIEPWVAFLISLRGQYGTFLLGDPLCATPQGSASATPGTPVVDSITSDNATLTISGAPLSATGYLKAGDYIQLGTGATSTLHKVLEDVDTDGSGNADIEIWPHLRRSIVVSEAVTVSNAKGLFRLASNSSEWMIDNSNNYTISFSAVEAI